jgi:hypothetical protein
MKVHRGQRSNRQITKPICFAVKNRLSTFAWLKDLMREALRTQHPEWVQPDGKSPICDGYEARLTELLVMAAGRCDTREAPVPRAQTFNAETLAHQ